MYTAHLPQSVGSVDSDATCEIRQPDQTIRVAATGGRRDVTLLYDAIIGGVLLIPPGNYAQESGDRHNRGSKMIGRVAGS
jgi:hypothetical protein